MLAALIALMTVTQTHPAWAIGPFHKDDVANPVLWPQKRLPFACPMRKTLIDWEENDVFNPAALVDDHGDVVLLYRAEDRLQAGLTSGQRTSRVGFAISKDGVHFDRGAAPVLYPADDAFKQWEWEGGCEDPRVVRASDGEYWMTYTAWNRQAARLSVAHSRDLKHWTKCGPAFSGADRDVWTKSGSIVSSYETGSPVATKIDGKYWMYFGEGVVYVAHSEDMQHWTIVKDAVGKWIPMLKPRPRHCDSALVEPGPPAMLTKNGIVLIYNGKNSDNPALPVGTYAPCQALFDRAAPSKLIERTGSYFMRPDREYETQGQVSQVCFVEGLVRHRGKWLLYYGTADSKIAVAEAPADR